MQRRQPGRSGIAVPPLCVDGHVFGSPIAGKSAGGIGKSARGTSIVDKDLTARGARIPAALDAVAARLGDLVAAAPLRCDAQAIRPLDDASRPG